MSFHLKLIAFVVAFLGLALVSTLFRVTAIEPNSPEWDVVVDREAREICRELGTEAAIADMERRKVVGPDGTISFREEE